MLHDPQLTVEKRLVDRKTSNSKGHEQTTASHEAFESIRTTPTATFSASSASKSLAVKLRCELRKRLSCCRRPRKQRANHVSRDRDACTHGPKPALP
jgi:hypothetical protein